jgi:hypothetical protein
VSKRNRPRSRKRLRFFGETDRCIHEELMRIGFNVKRGRYFGPEKIARYYWR